MTTNQADLFLDIERVYPVEESKHFIRIMLDRQGFELFERGVVITIDMGDTKLTARSYYRRSGDCTVFLKEI